MNPRARIGRGALMVIVLLAVGCSETPKSRYSSIADAERDGAVTRGWLPAVLAPDATYIEETHDLDSNRGYGTFALNDSLIKRLNSVCKPSLNVAIPASKAHWWKKDSSRDRQPRDATYQCEDFLVSVDLEKRLGRFWTNPN